MTRRVERAISDSDIAGWEAERGKGMTSAIGEYTPDEFWWVLDELKRLRAAQQPAAVDGAIAALPAKWLAEMPSRDECFGNRDASGAAGAYEKCIDDLTAALAAQPQGDKA